MCVCFKPGTGIGVSAALLSREREREEREKRKEEGGGGEERVWYNTVGDQREVDGRLRDDTGWTTYHTLCFYNLHHFT